MSFLGKHYAVAELRGSRDDQIPTTRLGWAVVRYEAGQDPFLVMVYRDQIEAERLCAMLAEQQHKAIQRAVALQHKLDAIEMMVRGLSWVVPAPEYAALLEILGD